MDECKPLVGTSVRPWLKDCELVRADGPAQLASMSWRGVVENNPSTDVDYFPPALDTGARAKAW